MPLYKCETCGFYTENKKHYSNHLNTNKHKKNVCNVINTVENQNTNSKNVSEYLCNLCGKSFNSRNNMYRHIKHYCKVNNDIDLKIEAIRLYNKLEKYEKNEKKINELEKINGLNKKLKEENRDLKEKLNNKHKEYKKYIDFKNEEIRDKNIIIQDLMKVNKEQRQRIMDLEINRKILNKQMENPSSILNQIF